MFQVARIQPPPQLDEMDVDVGEGPSHSVVAPGEVIASAKEYMR